MRFWRALTLSLGPVLLISFCYSVAAPTRSATSLTESMLNSESSRIDADELLHRCQSAAESLRQRSDSQWSLVIHPPYILAGDLSLDAMESLYHQTIVPTVHALQVDYFDREPVEPIILLLMSDDESYRTALKLFGHSRRLEYSGLYAREQRTVILNLSTGAGTIAHELTHALAHADFPQMPEWLDEGLASLHEEADFSADGRHLIGRGNWRLRYLQEAEQRGCWKPLEHLFDRQFGERDVAALDYAIVRYFCLYLQEQGLLPAYYRKCRHLSPHDATGRAALLSLMPGQNLVEIDAGFRDWLRERP